MRTVYRVLASLIALAVVLQVASIALAGFTVAADAEDGRAIGADYTNLGQSYHSMAGMLIAALALLLLIVSFFTDVPRGRLLAAAIVGLVAVQIALALAAFGVPAIGILHGFNGLAIAGLAGTAGSRARTPSMPAADG